MFSDPQFVTFELEGYERTVRSLDYGWSVRNVLLSIPFVLGVPGIILWGKQPLDLYVFLERASEKPAAGGP